MAHVDDGQLNAFLDGELSKDESRSVEAHLASCAECRARFDEARAFLKESGELLDLLLPRAAGASAAPARSADAAAPRPSRVSSTAKERAIEIDGATQQSPAVRPIFAREGVSPAPAAGSKAPLARRRLVTWTRLAWAASIILALGVGYLSGNRRTTNRPLSDLAMPPSTDSARALRQEQAAPAAPAAQAPQEHRQVTPASGATTRARSRPTLVKPSGARGAPKTAPVQVLANVPQPTARANETAKTGAPAPAVAGVASDQRRDANLAARAAPAPAPTDRVAAAAAQAPARPNRAAAPPSPAAAGGVSGNRLEEAAAQTGELQGAGFRRVSLEEAVRRLSGSMRLIDGMAPARVEVGPGRLVPGAAPEREVVRVVYADATGRPLFLDQQPGEGADASVNGLMSGDTLVTPTGSGASQVRWVDRNGFWLSLTGTAPLDSLRAMVARIR